MKREHQLQIQLQQYELEKETKRLQGLIEQQEVKQKLFSEEAEKQLKVERDKLMHVQNKQAEELDAQEALKKRMQNEVLKLNELQKETEREAAKLRKLQKEQKEEVEKLNELRWEKEVEAQKIRE